MLKRIRVEEKVNLWDRRKSKWKRKKIIEKQTKIGRK